MYWSSGLAGVSTVFIYLGVGPLRKFLVFFVLCVACRPNVGTIQRQTRAHRRTDFLRGQTLYVLACTKASCLLFSGKISTVTTTKLLTAGHRTRLLDYLHYLTQHPSRGMTKCYGTFSVPLPTFELSILALSTHTILTWRHCLDRKTGSWFGTLTTFFDLASAVLNMGTVQQECQFVS